MTALLLYGYSRGIYSSRKLEQACHERVDFMAVTAMAKPDHTTIHKFRQRHRAALAELFVQVLRLCQKAGLVKLGHVALDGTKMKANASKRKAMSYGRMLKVEPELAEEVERWLENAEQIDEEEDEEHGPDRRGDEMPDWVKDKARKLAKIREAKAALEAEAQEDAEELKKDLDRRGRKPGKRQKKRLEGVPEDKAQKNFTDPESRIMRTGTIYVQAYNCQAAVDDTAQVIVAHQVTAEQNDDKELLPLMDGTEENTGRMPKECSADFNYCSEENLEGLVERGVRGYVATGRQERGMSSPTNREKNRKGPWTRQMRLRLRRGGWRSRYRIRKKTVEPVFGQIKENRGFRRFLMRGLERVTFEWALLCTAHNLLKLAKARSI
jgi:IS5 family transposase